MAGMTWLHLSDWHQRGKDFDRDVVRDALIDDISKRKLINANLAHIDFIIFSGDVAFSGQAEEYEAAREYLFNPVLEATELNTDRLFVVPGNHDLDRNKFRFLSHDVMYPFDSYEKVKTWLTNDDNRNHLLQPFAAYKKFTLEFTGQDEPDYANIRRLVVDEKQVALLGCNSALMCGRHVEKKIVNDSGHLVIGEPQVYEPLRQIAKADVRIAVLHHPFEWLVDFDRDNVEDRLKRDCHFILLGHQHKPNVYMEQGLGGNCVIIPAGASYDRRVAPNPLYNNSYNFVHLDFETIKGTVYLRRWSERRKEWIRDEDTYELGKFEFSLPGSLKNLASSPPVTPIISTGTSHTADEETIKPHKQDSTLSSKTQVSQQPPNNMPASFPPSPPEPTRTGEIAQIDKNNLLEKLSRCILATFNKVVFCSGVQEGDLPGEGADRSTKAIRLIEWAESSGPGLKKLYECYEWAAFGKKKTI